MLRNPVPRRRVRPALAVAVAAAVCLARTGSAPAADPPVAAPGSLTVPAGAPLATGTPDQQAAYRYLLGELTSGDEGRAKAAVEDVRRRATKLWNSRGAALQVLIDAKRYDDVQSVATRLLRDDPGASTIGLVQKVRVQAYMAAGKLDDALSAARTYYDVCPLKSTVEAINLVAACLAHARPDDPGLAKRFRRQQAAWAATGAQPPTAAAGAGGAVPTAAAAGGDDLGPPVLATIPVDDKPYAAVIAALPEPTTYAQAQRKGGLLLLSGRAKEARVAFAESETFAGTADQTKAAVENQAKAIRAEHGCVGPANDFLAGLQNQK